MKKTTTAVLLASAALLPLDSHAIFRAYLSPQGSDANPCTLVAPCRLLPAALTAVDSGGEIWILDSGNYNTGHVFINKSVTILAVPGALGSVVAMAGNAISLSAPGIEVTLRNLAVVPFVGGGGVSGVQVPVANAQLNIEGCVIAGMSSWGVIVNGASTLRIADSIVRGNSLGGVLLESGGTAAISRSTIAGNAGPGVYAHGIGTVTTTVDVIDSTLSNNTYGVFAFSEASSAPVKVGLRGSQLVRNSSVGLMVQTTGASVSAASHENLYAGNANGIVSQGAGAFVTATGDTLAHTIGTALFQSSGGVVRSTATNAVRNNAADISGSLTPAALQ